MRPEEVRCYVLDELAEIWLELTPFRIQHWAAIVEWATDRFHPQSVRFDTEGDTYWLILRIGGTSA